jgi:hypothetical protein
MDFDTIWELVNRFEIISDLTAASTMDNRMVRLGRMEHWMSMMEGAET